MSDNDIIKDEIEDCERFIEMCEDFLKSYQATSQVKCVSQQTQGKTSFPEVFRSGHYTYVLEELTTPTWTLLKSFVIFIPSTENT